MAGRLERPKLVFLRRSIIQLSAIFGFDPDGPAQGWYPDAPIHPAFLCLAKRPVGDLGLFFDCVLIDYDKYLFIINSILPNIAHRSIYNQ